MSTAPVIPLHQPEPEYRTPPHNIEAEQGLLAAILVNNAAYERVSEIVRAEHFYHPHHQAIYGAISSLIDAGGIADIVIVASQLPEMRQYIGELVQSVVTIINASTYARAIHAAWLRRRLVEIGTQAVNDAIDGGDAPALLADAEEQLFALHEIGGGGRSSEPVTLRDAALAAVAEIRLAHASGKTRGILTGLIDLDEKLGGLAPGNLVIIAGRASMGKAQPLTSLVMTVVGWRQMGDLRLGDELASADGQYSFVAGIFPQGQKEIFRVTFSDGRSTRCTAEHLWAVDSSSWPGTPKVLTTATLAEMISRKKHQNRVFVPMVTGDFGTDDALIVDPWLLGVLIGNGSMHGGQVSVSTADAATLYRVQGLLDVGMRAVANGDNGYGYRLSRRHGSIGPNPLGEQLRALGLMDTMSETKFVPAPYLAATRRVRLEVLRGLMDTDGWVETFGAVRYATSSPQLARDAAYLARSLGAVCTTSVKHPHYISHGKKVAGLPSYVLNIRHLDPQSLFSLKRKQRRATRTKVPRLTIRSIVSDGIEEARCIRVTHPSQLYITDDFIVTHNSALVRSIGENMAKTIPGGLFSLEMQNQEVGMSALAGPSGIDTVRMRNLRLNMHDIMALQEAAAALPDSSLYIHDRRGITMGELSRQARRMKRQHGIGFLIVDYLQLIVGPQSSRDQNRVSEVTAITMGLKALAGELGIPIIALSQLSRKVEERDDKRPMLSDLRESGSIEQDADTVIFIYREEYYLLRSEPQQTTKETADKFTGRIADWQAACARAKGIAELIIAKQRLGGLGTVKVRFDGPALRFENLFQGGISV